MKKRKPAKSRFRKIIGWLHLWIGIITGVVIFIVSITGCLFVFEEELFDIFHSKITHVAETGPQKPVSLLIANAQKKLGKDKPIKTLVLTNGVNKSFVFEAYEAKKPDEWGLSYFSQVDYMNRVFVNQYTGEVLSIVDIKYEFFNIVEQLHRQLLLVKPLGRLIVGICILLFVFMLLSGIVLWWPKNYKQFKRSIRIKWNSKWKRINYDLHNSVGFYVLPAALLIAVTGLVWSFSWWENGIYQIMGGNDKKLFRRELPALTGTADTTLNKTDAIYARLRKVVKNDWEHLVLNLPDESNKQAMAFVHISNNKDGWKGASYFYFDGRDGRLFDTMPHEKKSLAMKWRNSNYYIHTGGIYGLWTKILAFIASLVCASLPITGFLIWWGKHNKKYKNSRIPTMRSSIKNRPMVHIF
ncbi:PepSY-associated TM helix domain-containing protein [Arcticibacter tournemirensis]|uniref:PepSY domain-containing protein n=1 Tax=Arcticibacter tournemirensis TaxID=699437 RepID=A0A4Q0MAA2_9SPHI|nr:PepSY-associated TM helix domain-containing protein [Arcticibacter tournemirensis]RXF70167.1 PepSY domain-containing protein [Arcticibacter tournemirensis]